jgi:hypothetical protein
MKTNEIITIANELASIGIFVNVTAFYLMVFGKEGKIQDRPMWEQYFVRIGLLTIATGSLLNIIADKAPPMNELIVNIGLSVLFTWASIFHYKVFVK